MTQRENSRSPGLAELIRLAIKQAQAELHVSMPGRIDKYDAAEQKADIKPLIMRRLVASDGTELAPESLPIIHDVPICFPRSSGFFLSWPLAAGDLVHVVFVERSLDQWLSKQGEETDPLDVRMHNMSDAVAYPGLYPRALSLAEASPDNAVFGRDEGIQLHITPGDVAEFQIGGTADVSMTIAETLQSWWDTQVKPKLDAFDAHVHPTGVGPSGPPAPLIAAPAMDTAIISDNVKLKDN
jgi:hypothetical protein